MLWSKRYKRIMIQGVRKCCDWKGVNAYWPKMYKRIVTERLWTVINERVRTVLDRKDAKLILTERMRIDLDHDKKGTNGLWPKACKCVMNENVQMGYDRKGANGHVWTITNGRDQKVANGSWPKNCKRVVTKGCKWSLPKDCKWVVTKKCKRVVTKRGKRIVTIWVWTDRNWKNVNGSSMKGCKRVISKGVPMNHDRRGKNGSWLKKCEQDITERMLKVNHGDGDIRVWPFLENIKSLSRLEYIIFYDLFSTP